MIKVGRNPINESSDSIRRNKNTLEGSVKDLSDMFNIVQASAPNRKLYSKYSSLISKFISRVEIQRVMGGNQIKLIAKTAKSASDLEELSTALKCKAYDAGTGIFPDSNTAYLYGSLGTKKWLE